MCYNKNLTVLLLYNIDKTIFVIAISPDKINMFDPKIANYVMSKDSKYFQFRHIYNCTRKTILSRKIRSQNYCVSLFIYFIK